jgi:peptide/nickel transport system substrate-binding protein
VIPLGRRFHLSRDASWSDGSPVSAADVRATVELLQRSDKKGFAPGWPHLLPSEDPFVVGLQLGQGYLEPLALMCFKILPASRNLNRADDAGFAAKPLGSGPFQFQGPKEGEAIFTANPSYHREARGGAPQIREIHFIHSENPAQDFASGRLDLLLDLPTATTQQLHSIQGVEVETLRNRRIYFLAVNQRNQIPLGVRRAIAHAINREAIVRDILRKGSSEPKPHRALDGPFPPGSWACPERTTPLYNVQLAKAFLKQEAPSSPVHLKLKCANDDVALCEAIRDQVNAVIAPSSLEVVPRSERELHHDVEDLHDYELAYYIYDYPTELYWLWPLFDRKDNYLGYKDGELTAKLQQATDHREFAKVREYYHELHKMIVSRMPFIPLWQIDSHIAVRRDLKIPSPLDPLRVFANVQRWQLNR